MEEIKKEEITPQKKVKKSNKKRNIIIIVISVIAIIVVGLGGYFVFNRDDVKNNGNQNNDDNVTNCSSSQLYVREDGKKYKLNFLNHNSEINKGMYELVSDNEKNEVYLGENIADYTTIYFNDNAWYLLDECNKKIISYYENRNSDVRYFIEKTQDKEFVVVYYYDENENVKISLVSTANKEIISFNENNPNAAVIKNENIFLIFDNKIVCYDLNGTLLETKKVDSIINNNNDTYVLVKIENLYYAITFNDFKENKLEKTTYKGSNKEFDLYEISYNDESDDKIHYDYYAYYNGKMVGMTVDEFENDEKYASYYVNDGAQCPEHNFLVNKKTKKIEKYGNVDLGFIKTKNGYYFTRDNNSGCSLEYTTGVYTTDWKLLGTELAYKKDGIDSQGNIYLRDKSDIVKYDINGKELLRNSIYKEIGNGVVVDDTLYVIVKDNNNVIHLLNLKDNSKVEIPTKEDEFTDLWLEIYINALDDKSGLSIGWYSSIDDREIDFEYDFSTKKLEEINK